MKRVLKIGLLVIAFIALLIGIVYAFSWLFPVKAENRAWYIPRPSDNQPLVVSHQGGEGIRPTNTEVAFRDSYTMGADVLDADVHMTLDGVLVLAHDETIDRLTDGTGAIRDMTFDQLQQYDAAYDFTTDNGATFPYRGKGLKIMKLETLLRDYPDRRIGLEIKQTTTEAAVRMCQMIRDTNQLDNVLISSFSQENMDVFRKECPEVAASATEDEVRAFYIYHRIGLSGLYRPPFDSLQIPEYSGKYQLLTPQLIADAQRKDIAVIPWTINKTEDLNRIIELGVDGINTDFLIECSHCQS